MAASSALPAVVLDNVPGHVRRNGDSTCQAFFGSKTGREAGVCFWRVDQSQPRFTAVFRMKENRDKWHESSTLLRDMKRTYGVVSSMVYYDRKMECVVKGEEGQDYGQAKNRNRSDLNNTVIDNKLEKKPLPFKELKNVWGDDMDDLDKIFQGGTVLLGSRDGNSNLRTPQPPEKDLPSPGKTGCGSPSSGFVSVSSAESDTGSLSARSPPPLRLPVLTNSDLLRRLVKAAEAQLTERDGDRDGEERRVAQAVGNSWQGDVRQLERLYEEFLGDPSMDRETLKQELSSIFSWSGSSIVSRSEALQLTEQFIVEAGSRGGVDMKNSLLQFLSENQKKYQVAQDETLFILSRNNLDLKAIFNSFRAVSNVVTFRKMIENNINLSGPLFQEFSQLLIDFLVSKSKDQSSERTQSAPQTPAAVKPQNIEVNLETALKELKISIEKKDQRKSQNLLVEVVKKVEGLKELKDLEEQAAQAEKELRRCREENHEKMTQVNHDNKTLRARNTSLEASLAEALENKEATAKKLSVICKALDNFLRGEEVEVPQSFRNDEDVAKLLSGLMKIKAVSSVPRGHYQGGQTIKVVGSQGNVFSVRTNRSNNLCMREVERILGRKVTSFHAPDVEGEGQSQMIMAGGYVNCPELGWGNGVYWANTEESQGKCWNSGTDRIVRTNVRLRRPTGTGEKVSQAGPRSGTLLIITSLIKNHVFSQNVSFDLSLLAVCSELFEFNHSTQSPCLCFRTSFNT